MLITYESMTGNVRRFVRKLEQKTKIKTMEITEDLKVNEPFIHITYTIKFGQIPEKLRNSYIKTKIYCWVYVQVGIEIGGTILLRQQINSHSNMMFQFSLSLN